MSRDHYNRYLHNSQTNQNHDMEANYGMDVPHPSPRPSVEEYNPTQSLSKRRSESLQPDIQPSKRQRCYEQHRSDILHGLDYNNQSGNGSRLTSHHTWKPEVGRQDPPRISSHGYLAPNSHKGSSHDEVQQSVFRPNGSIFSTSLFGPRSGLKDSPATTPTPLTSSNLVRTTQRHELHRPMPTDSDNYGRSQEYCEPKYVRNVHPNASLFNSHQSARIPVHEFHNSSPRVTVKPEPLYHQPTRTQRKKGILRFDDDEDNEDGISEFRRPRQDKLGDRSRREYLGHSTSSFLQPPDDRRESLYSLDSDKGSIDNPIDLIDDDFLPSFLSSRPKPPKSAQIKPKRSVHSRHPRAKKPTQTAASRALKKDLQSTKNLRQQQNLQLQADVSVGSTDNHADYETQTEPDLLRLAEEEASGTAAGETSLATAHSLTAKNTAANSSTAINQADIDKSIAALEHVFDNPLSSTPVELPVREIAKISMNLIPPGHCPYTGKTSKKNQTKRITVEEAANINASNEATKHTKPSAKRGQSAAEKAQKEKEKAEKAAQRKITTQLKRDQLLRDNIRRSFIKNAPEGVEYPEDVINDHVEETFKKKKEDAEKRKAKKAGAENSSEGPRNDKNDVSGAERTDAETDAAAEELQEKLDETRNKIAELAKRSHVSQGFTRAVNTRAEDTESEVSEEDPDPESETERQIQTIKAQVKRATPDAEIDIDNDWPSGNEDEMAAALDDALKDDVDLFEDKTDTPATTLNAQVSYDNPTEENKADTVLVHEDKHLTTEPTKTKNDVSTFKKEFWVYTVYRTFVVGGIDQPEKAVKQFSSKKKANQHAEEVLQARKWGEKKFMSYSRRHNKDGLLCGGSFIDDDQNGMRVVVRKELHAIEGADDEILREWQEATQIPETVWLIIEVIPEPVSENGKEAKVVQQVVNTYNNREMANTAAGKHFLALSKPPEDASDQRQLEYEDLATQLHQHMKTLDDDDESLFCCTGSPDGDESGPEFTVFVEKQQVLGPRN